MYKRIVSAVLSASLLLCAAYIPAAAKDEKVTLIVETEGAPLLAAKNAVRMGAAEYIGTDEAKETEARILSAQSAVKSTIERRTNADVNSGFTYTSVINGFSMEAHKSDIERIKAVDGVKNVYISEKFEIPTEPDSNDSISPGFGAQMMNAQAMYDAGYDGRGQTVAIIDAAFDTSHNFFASGVEEPKLTKSSIQEYIENNEFNANISANQVYKSEKIPFAYDYADSDADTYDAAIEHGTSVAGITAGKNGVCGGITFSGVAPEAQLVLMKVADSEGSMYLSTIIAAMDDASKMRVGTVNISLGSVFAEHTPYAEASDNLRGAGIALVCAAGNFDRYDETTDHPDYTYNEIPASFSPFTAVASIDPSKKLELFGKITVGDDEEISIPQHSEPFFGKFADKYYDYVYGDTLDDFEAMGDISGKIAVTPYESDVKSDKLLEMGVIGVIFVSEDEEFDSVTTASDEKMPGILVGKSIGEKLKSAENKAIKTIPGESIESKDSETGMAYYSSWGTQSDLELKPEITAPGSDILSAGNDDEYANDSGTSMAAPQITGAMALMSAFTDAKYPDVKGADKVALMENILMSSADIVFQDEAKTLPESPRRQGAGLANLSDALTLPVILKGDNGKSKLSLKDNLTDEITLKFTAKNLTSEPVTYDKIKIYAFTDNYEEKDGKNMITDSVPLEFEPAGDNPASVTLSANEEKEITLKINLDSTQTAANKEIFTNGFWVDGFVVLSSSDDSVTAASIPYTGFYGDWTAFNAMPPSYFEEGGSVKNGGLILYVAGNPTPLGTNIFAEDGDKSEYENEAYVGFSENLSDAKSYYLSVRMLRSLKDVKLTLKDSSGAVLSEDPVGGGLARLEGAAAELAISKIVANYGEGDYTLTLSGNLGYGNSSREEKTYKLYIDNTFPEIQNPRIYEENGKTYASFTASDNRYLMVATAWDASDKTVTVPIKAKQKEEIKIDVTDLDRETLEFSVADYAYNENAFTIGTVSAEITDSVITGSSAAVFANVTNTAGDADVDVIIAVYDGDGRLTGVSKQNALLISGGKKMFTFGFDNAADAADIKLFVWKHDEMTPLCKAVNKAV